MVYNVSEMDKEWIQKAKSQLEIKIYAECERLTNIIPYIPDEHGRYIDTDNIFWWTNGFWAGIMWQMYHATNQQKYLETARTIGERISITLGNFNCLTHDVGFMFLLTAAADYRITGSENAKKQAMKAATVLAARYNPAGQYIRAWNNNFGENDSKGLYIVDTLMNLPLLYWMYQESGDYRFMAIANAHAEKTLKYTLRADGSSNHIVECDPVTGNFISAPKGQGYATGSSWSRGQSWALYGMTLAARYIGGEDYLNAAKRTAHYFIACSAVTDFVPRADFRAPQEPTVYDATAGLCAVCGLLELSELVGENEKQLYISGALKILKAITHKHCDWNPDTDGIILNGSVSYYSGRNTRIIYGDYFLTEALLRLTDEYFMIW